MKANLNSHQISGHIVDVVHRKTYKGIIEIQDQRIQRIIPSDEVENQYILPGLLDAHIHIESSMLIPSEFARAAVRHGSIGSVSDPHEIANVLGIEGVKFMIENGERVPFKFFFGAPSCVPATNFESSGAVLDVAKIEELLRDDRIKYLAEMMNYPGVIYQDEGVMAKLDIARKYHKPVDGHAPGLKGKDAASYVGAGISTDHECFTVEEAVDKINSGMLIQIREGSAAKNFDALHPLLKSYPEKVMLCSDDKHPDDLILGHINKLVMRALALGYDLFDVLRSCTLIPKEHYKLDNGLLQEGDFADMIVVDNLEDFNVKQTYINGQLVAENGKNFIEAIEESLPNKFVAEKITIEDLKVRVQGDKLKVIEAMEGQLITRAKIINVMEDNQFYDGDLDQDILKIVVLNRYKKSKASIGFINGIGLKEGAIASTVAHDSHNIIAVGTNDADIVSSINQLIDSSGGIVATADNRALHLVLPVAGLMSQEPAEIVATKYEKLNRMVKSMGSPLNAPFMTLSFMALLVIPDLKISDKGLFDGKSFQFTELFE